MQGIIIYKGKYGATQQYATWLAAALDLPVRKTEEINGEELDRYDYLLLGTSVYIGKLQIQNWLKENLTHIENKKIFIFQVAGAPPEEKEKRLAYNRAGIPGEILPGCTCYFLPGRMIMRRLGWKDRFLLKMGARLTKDPVARKSMLADHDDVEKERIKEMVAAVKKYRQERSIPEEKELMIQH